LVTCFDIAFRFFTTDVDPLADLAEHLVPRPADVAQQVAAQRGEVLVEVLAGA